MQELSKAAVENAFRELGELLVRAGKMAEIAVYGGAVIPLSGETQVESCMKATVFDAGGGASTLVMGSGGWPGRADLR